MGEEEVHGKIVETIIGLAEPAEGGQLGFSEENQRQLAAVFREALAQPTFAAAVAGFVRAVGAFQQGEQPLAVEQLLEIGTNVLAQIEQEGGAPGERLKSALTGAENLASMRPVGAGPAPEGAQKATAFIRPLPRIR